MKRWIKVLLALGVSGLVIGGLVVVSGIVPVAASSGHWPITKWFLGFAMSRSVSTQSMAIEAPELEDRRLVLIGAGHYETGCVQCHGSPEFENPRVAARLTPPPPYLPSKIADWKPRELFYIVKHGVKLTGMPAWPANDRDDEVWAMVAFLLKFQDMDADEYARLTGTGVPYEGDGSQQSRLAHEHCARCHGVDGTGRGEDAFPSLAGQSQAYVVEALMAYAGGDRMSGIMEPIAARLSEDEAKMIAEYYAKQVGNITGDERADAPSNDSAIDRGESIAESGIPSQNVPSCIDCHGPSDSVREPQYPILAGQSGDYLVGQLKLFKGDKRGGSSRAPIMQRTAEGLTEEQMHDVAAYYASLRRSQH